MEQKISHARPRRRGRLDRGSGFLQLLPAVHARRRILGAETPASRTPEHPVVSARRSYEYLKDSHD